MHEGTKARRQGEWNRCRGRQVVRQSWNVTECGAVARNRLKSRIMKEDLPSYAEEFGLHPVVEAENH